MSSKLERKATDSVPMAEVVTGQTNAKENQVRFNSEVIVHLLPEEEASDAEMARHSPWLQAPLHDEYWDGDRMTWRERELTSAELKELLFQLRVKRVLPTSIFNLFKKYRRRQSMVARMLDTDIAAIEEEGGEVLPDTQRPPLTSQVSAPNTLNGRPPTKEQTEKIDQYFQRLAKMDQPRKPKPSMTAVVELNDVEDYTSPMASSRNSDSTSSYSDEAPAPRKRSAAVDHTADEEIMPFNVPRISVAEESVTGSEVGASDSEDEEREVVIATIAEEEALTLDDENTPGGEARGSIDESSKSERRKSSQRKKSKGKSKKTSRNRHSTGRTKTKKKGNKTSSTSRASEGGNGSFILSLPHGGLRASIAEVTSVNSYEATLDDVKEKSKRDSTSSTASLGVKGKSRASSKSRHRRKSKKSLSRNRTESSASGVSISQEHDPAPKEVEEKFNLLLKKLEKLDGLSKSKVRKNRRLREALQYYRQGSYSFTTLEQDLDAV